MSFNLSLIDVLTLGPSIPNETISLIGIPSFLSAYVMSLTTIDAVADPNISDVRYLTLTSLLVSDQYRMRRSICFFVSVQILFHQTGE